MWKCYWLKQWQDFTENQLKHSHFAPPPFELLIMAMQILLKNLSLQLTLTEWDVTVFSAILVSETTAYQW